MYTLRIVTDNGTRNHYLGRSYTKVLRTYNEGMFNNIRQRGNPLIDDGSDLIMFIEGEDFNCHPIFESYDTFIVTESGNTYERLVRTKAPMAKY